MSDALAVRPNRSVAPHWHGATPADSSVAQTNPEKQARSIKAYEDFLNHMGDDEAAALFANGVHPTHAVRPG